MIRRAPLLPPFLVLLVFRCFSAAPAALVLNKGFTEKPDSRPPPLSSSPDLLFQSILKDSGGNFSFGFLTETTTDQLVLAVVHLPSDFPVWRGRSAARRSDSITLSFDGRLRLYDESENAVPWEAGSSDGNLVQLLPSSNLQVLSSNGNVIWQSFDVPFDTLVSGQNLSSAAAVVSADRRFSFRLGTDFMALYINPDEGKTDAVMYKKITALQTDARIVKGGAPIYARLNQTGYLALYQNETSRVHVETFGSSNRNLSGLWRLTLEDDGNLRGYYWNASAWDLDYEVIADPCDLPAYCGAYGLCAERKCQCLDGRAAGDSCLPPGEGDLCDGKKFTVLRQKGVDLPFREQLAAVTVASQEECEQSCERNCSCWGALYNNQTGFCYKMPFHVGTLTKSSDNRVGYFKVRVTGGGDGDGSRKRAVLASLLVLAGVVLVVGVAWLWWRRERRRSTAGGTLMGDGLSPGPYKQFHGNTSFRDVELSSSSHASGKQ